MSSGLDGRRAASARRTSTIGPRRSLVLEDHRVRCGGLPPRSCGARADGSSPRPSRRTSNAPLSWAGARAFSRTHRGEPPPQRWLGRGRPRFAAPVAANLHHIADSGDDVGGSPQASDRREPQTAAPAPGRAVGKVEAARGRPDAAPLRAHGRRAGGAGVGRARGFEARSLPLLAATALRERLAARRAGAPHPPLHPTSRPVSNTASTAAHL